LRRGRRPLASSYEAGLLDRVQPGALFAIAGCQRPKRVMRPSSGRNRQRRQAMIRTIDPTRARAALVSISLVAAVASVTAMAPAHAARIRVPAAPGRPQVIATIP